MFKENLKPYQKVALWIVALLIFVKNYSEIKMVFAGTYTIDVIDIVNDILLVSGFLTLFYIYEKSPTARNMGITLSLFVANSVLSIVKLTLGGESGWQYGNDFAILLNCGVILMLMAFLPYGLHRLEKEKEQKKPINTPTSIV